MNTGKQSIQWLYGQLMVDDGWAVQTPDGFTWWADKNAQTIEVIGEEHDDSGEVAYLIAVRTEFLRDLNLTDRSLALVGTLMSNASMAGPVYDAKTKVLTLRSLVRVHQGIAGWINPLISLAAVMQLAETRAIAPEMARAANAQVAVSGHPVSGIRVEPDEMVSVAEQLIVPEGKSPCKWPGKEFKKALKEYMQGPPSVLSSNAGSCCTAEFPFGDGTSLCRLMGTQTHPRYGNGLFLLQSFPTRAMSDSDGIRLALSLNEAELIQKPWGYGFGSYAFRDAMIHFSSFLPNFAYRPGLLGNLYFASANRAKAVAIHLTGRDWAEESFSARRSTTGWLMDLLGRKG